MGGWFIGRGFEIGGGGRCLRGWLAGEREGWKESGDGKSQRREGE